MKLILAIIKPEKLEAVKEALNGVEVFRLTVYVDARYENQGIGGKLLTYAESLARSRGVKVLFCLSTQAINYFVQRGGFRLGTPEDLPPSRREVYEKNGRRSQVLVKDLADG